jgi:hypothetical protein
MGVAAQQPRSLGQIPLPIVARAFVRRTQQLDHRHQPPGLAVADLEIRLALDIYARQQDPAGRGQHGCRGVCRTGPARLADGHVSVAQQMAFVGPAFVNVQILFQFHKIRRTDLRTECLCHVRQESFVKVSPSVFLLQVRVHAGKR